MDTIATQLRALQFLSHRAHNMVKGPTFFEDHEFLGEIYPAYEAAFDSVIERIIGTGSATVSIVKINKAAAEMSSVAPQETKPDVFLRIILKGEKDLCALIDKAMSKASNGTQNLLQGLCDQSEMRQYQLKQRLG